MSFAPRRFSPPCRLSRAESAALAHEAIERARQALRASRSGSGAVARPAEPPAGLRQRLAERARVRRRPLWLRALEMPGLEFVVIASCVTVGAAGAMLTT